MKKIILILIFALVVNVYATPKTDVAVFSACVDGDTAYFKVDEDTIKVRFLAVDTPELKDFLGKETSDFTCDTLVNAKEILLEYDIGNMADKYGRILAWVWVDKNLLQKTLIEKGYANTAYIYNDYRYVNSLCIEEKKAKESKVGLWVNDDAKYKYCKEEKIDENNYNISYENILKESKEISNNIDTDKIKKASKAADKAFNYIEGNTKKIGNIGTYLMLLIALLYVLFNKKSS